VVAPADNASPATPANVETTTVASDASEPKKVGTARPRFPAKQDPAPPAAATGSKTTLDEQEPAVAPASADAQNTEAAGAEQAAPSDPSSPGVTAHHADNPDHPAQADIALKSHPDVPLDASSIPSSPVYGSSALDAGAQDGSAASASIATAQTLAANAGVASSAALTGPAASPAGGTIPGAVPLAGLGIEIAASLQDGKHRFDIRLDPPELGRVDVRLDVDRNGRVSSRLIAERTDTLDLLRRDAPQLQQALRDAGFNTSDNTMQFSLRDQGFGNQGQAGGNGPNAPASSLVVLNDTAANSTELPRSYSRLAGTGGGVDIRV
jgi:hypothetical protein